jgi:hypothetical protein
LDYVFNENKLNMRLIIKLVVSVVFFASTVEIYASSNILSESEPASSGFTTEGKTKTDESSFWEESTSPLSEEGSSIFEKSDDRKLYAPPPGEEGNPQKIAPLGGSDMFFLLSIGLFFGLIGCIRQRKHIVGV